MPDIVLDKKLLGKPEEKHWITYIKQRIKKNKNFLGFISGATGSGKSWSSLSICQDLDDEFNIDNVVFSGLELMNLINSGKLKRGSAIIFEEVGVEFSNKNWASVTNKMLNYLMQTFRHRGFILIMNSPFMDFVDSATRKLFHAELQTTGIDFNTKECKLKPQLIQYNGRLQKFYYKRLKVIKAEGVVPIDLWKVRKPSQELVETYEKKKTEYTTRLNQKIYDELQAVEDKKQKKTKDKELTDIQQEVLGMLKQGQTVKQIALSKGRAEAVIRKTMELVRKKGYDLIPQYKGTTITHYEVVSPIQETKANICDNRGAQ